MKKILLTMVALIFCIASAQAVPPQNSTSTAAFIGQSLAKHVSIADILVKLVKDGMNLQDAVGSVIKSGGSKQETLAAALLINPDFSYNDPTTTLSPTASGSNNTKKSSPVSTNSSMITLGKGGGASPF